MFNENAVVRFTERTGLDKDPGIYIKVKVMGMYNSKMQTQGVMLPIETAMDLVVGIAEEIAKYGEWNDKQAE